MLSDFADILAAAPPLQLLVFQLILESCLPLGAVSAQISKCVS